MMSSSLGVRALAKSRCQLYARSVAQCATLSSSRSFRSSPVSHTGRSPTLRVGRPKQKSSGRGKNSTPSEPIVPKLNTEELENFYSQQLFLFRCDVTMLKIDSAMKAYPRLRDLGILKGMDVSNLARQLHDKYRFTHDKRAVLPHCLRLIEDVEEGHAPPHPIASMHTLSCLKEMEEFDIATRHWNWLVEQGEEATDARVFGAAIECFAYQGAPLAELEELYAEARQRFSLDSLLHIPDAPRLIDVVLLQGIITARILHHDWRGAYKALDACLRMYPDRTPSRIFELFMYERPISEGTLVFFMACRAGSPPRAAVLTAMLKETLASSKDIKTMLRMVYTHAAAGGKVQFQVLSPLLNGLLSMIPQLAKITPERDAATLLSDVWTLCRQLLDAFANAGVLPKVGTLHSIITMGGRLRLPELVLIGLKEFTERNLAPIPETFVSLINAFGNLGDGSQVVDSWKGLVECKKQMSQGPLEWTFNEWKALVWASIMTGKSDFLESQLGLYGPHMAPELLSGVRQLQSEKLSAKSAKDSKKAASDASSSDNSTSLDSPASAESTTTAAVSATRLPSIDSVRREVENVTKILSDGLIQDFSTPMFAFIEDEYSRAPPLEMQSHPEFSRLFQALYDFKLASSDNVRRSSTFIELKELKLLNWKSINRLLYEAELYDYAAKHQELQPQNLALSKRKPSINALFDAEERARRRGKLSWDTLVAKAQALTDDIQKGSNDWNKESDTRIQFAVFGDQHGKP